MKFSRKLIFLATILIVVSIISMYFGSVKTIEGAATSNSGVGVAVLNPTMCSKGLTAIQITAGPNKGKYTCTDPKASTTASAPAPASSTTTNTASISPAALQCISTLSNGGSCSA